MSGTSTSIWPILIAGIGVTISLATLARTEWRYRSERRAANVTVNLVRLREKSRVQVDGEEKWAGYNLVLGNRGPAPATDVSLTIYSMTSEQPRSLELVDVAANEFPVRQLDVGALYPIRFVDRSRAWQTERRFEAHLQWTDRRRGIQDRSLPLRRGQTAQ